MALGSILVYIDGVMEHEHYRSQPSRIILNAAAFVVVMGGLHMARGIIGPVLLAAFIAIVCWPLVAWLRDRKVPIWLALAIVVGLILAIATVMGVIVGNSAKEFVANIPIYQELAKERLGEILQKIMHYRGLGRYHISELSFSGLSDSESLMNFAAKTANLFGNVMGLSVLVIMTAVFMLLEAVDLPAKVDAAFGTDEVERDKLKKFFTDIKGYLWIKTVMNLAMAVLVSISLALIGVDYPVLWGLVTFILHYIPNVGAIIAGIPATILAFVQLGLMPSLAAALIYVIINMVIGNLVEPRVMGQNLGLSTLVVFIGLLFWGYVLGTVGMFLSVPLTTAVKFALESREETKWLAILLGPEGGPPADVEA